MSEGYVSNINEVKTTLQKAQIRALHKIGILVEGEAKKNIRDNKSVDTGRLMSSITHQVDEASKSVVIGTNVEYAPYVEKGTGIHAADGDGRKTPWVYEDENGKKHFTHGQEPKPYLMPAIENNKNKVGELVEQEVKAFDG